MIRSAERLFRQFFPKRMKNHELFLAAVRNQKGIEIGGPSAFFSSKGFLPVYNHIKELDGCNFSSNTIWEGRLEAGNTFRYGKKTGQQIIAEGTDLKQIPNDHYDFLLSCHSLEHIANPILALTEWKRIVRPEGHIILILPHKDKTFDNKRPVTTLEHLIEDFNKNTPESDTTHFAEVISLHDLSQDSHTLDRKSLEQRVRDNTNNRCLHHHVFNTPLSSRLCDHVGFKILRIEHFNPFNIILLLQKPLSGKPDNSIYLDPTNQIYHNPKYPSDSLW